MKPRFLVALWIGTLLFAAVVPGAHAQTGNLDLAVAVDYQYGLQARFTLTTDRPAQLKSAQLYFHVGDSPQLEHRSLAIELTGAAQNYEVTFDLGSEPFPPFSTITCWWRIETSDGLSILSPKTSFFYYDNRRDWQLLADPPIEVRWMEAEAEWPQRVVPRARAMLDSFEFLLRLPSPDLVSIFIYSSSEDLRNGLLIANPSFAADYAVPAPRVLLLAATGDLLSPTQLDRIVAQGMTEALLFDATRERYVNIPSWFREGVGLLMVPGFNPETDPLLDEAVDARALPLREALCADGEDPPSAPESRRVQAASLLKYVLAEYGQDSARRTLLAYAEGGSCENAVKQALGRSMDQLEMEWLAATDSGAMVRSLAAQLSPWLLLLAPVLVLVVLSLLPIRRRIRLGGRSRPWSRPYENPDDRPEDHPE